MRAKTAQGRVSPGDGWLTRRRSRRIQELGSEKADSESYGDDTQRRSLVVRSGAGQILARVGFECMASCALPLQQVMGWTHPWETGRDPNRAPVAHIVATPGEELGHLRPHTPKQNTVLCPPVVLTHLALGSGFLAVLSSLPAAAGASVASLSAKGSHTHAFPSFLITRS